MTLLANICAVSTLIVCLVNGEETIEGWIYVDNWFELYFNGEKVATDPITFKPHNAVKVSFSAAETGLRSFAIWAQDFADDVTGLEERNGGTCLGDGGVLIHLSDGTVSSSDWKCFVTQEGPINPDECGVSGECTNEGDLCEVQYNEYPSCWSEAVCEEADSWSAASEYEDVDGWGVPTSDDECCGLDYEGDDCNTVYYPDGCGADKQDWGDGVFIWAGDLNYDNRIICRYEYCVGGGTDCTAAGVPTSSPSVPTPDPTRSPLAEGETHGPSTSPSTSPTTSPLTTSDSTTSTASRPQFDVVIICLGLVQAMTMVASL